MNLEVLGAEVALSSQEGLNVLAGGVEDGGKVGGSHLDGFLLFVLGDEKGWLEKGDGEEDCGVACKDSQIRKFAIEF